MFEILDSNRDHHLSSIHFLYPSCQVAVEEQAVVATTDFSNVVADAEEEIVEDVGVVRTFLRYCLFFLCCCFWVVPSNENILRSTNVYIGGSRGGYEGRGGYQSRGGGRGDGGGYRGGGRGDGGRGRGRGPDLSDLNKVLTNNIPVELGKNFSFYLYSVQCHDKNGGDVEQRHVRFNLFNTGVWDHLLADMPSDEKDDLKRVVFFQGSFFFAGRAVPGLERENLPVELSRGNDAEGNTMTVIGVQHFGPPNEVASTVPHGTAPDELTVDTFRCQQCNRSFSAEFHMKQHCSQTGHSPVYTPVRLDGPGNRKSSVLVRVMISEMYLIFRFDLVHFQQLPSLWPT